MPIDPQKLLAREFAPVEHTYSTRDTILYALGVGFGHDAVHPGELRYVYESAPAGMQAVPTFANVLGFAGFWQDQPDTGITWQKIVHAEQAIEIHRELPVAGKVIGVNRVTALHDKGTVKGALMVQSRSVTDAGTGKLLATITHTSMLRGDGGFGGALGPRLATPHVIPDRAPDAVCDLLTLAQAALIYRLSGDLNPLHADPAVAQETGFARPILHGVCTMGVALHAVLRTVLAYDARPVRAMRVRFTAPVLPGETIRTEIWVDGSVVSLRSSVVERNAVVLNSGRVDLAAS